MDGMRHMEKKGGFRFEEIRVGGGGAQSSEICQITADMFGLPVVELFFMKCRGSAARFLHL